MKKPVFLIIPVLVLCGLLCGCTPPAGHSPSKPTAPVIILPDESRPLPTVTFPIETFPKPTDDADYHLPPGEQPSVVPEIK